MRKGMSRVGLLVMAFLALVIGVQESAYLQATSGKSVTDVSESDHFIIEFKGSVARLIKKVEALGGTVERAHPQIGVAKVSGLTDKTVKTLVRAWNVKSVARDLEVRWIPPLDEVIEGIEIQADAESPNDPTEAFFFDDYQWNMKQVMAPDAWDIEQGNPVVRVAILDTGISPTHIDLVGRYDLAASVSFVNSEPFVQDLNFHGTFVSGIISTNNLGVAGIAPHVTMIGVKVLDYTGTGSWADIIAGILYAADEANADIINMSLGAYFPKSTPGVGGVGWFNGLLSRAVNYANSKGVLVVCSAGNDGKNLDFDGNWIHVPSQSGSAFSVSATAPWNQMNFDNLADYSNYGISGVDVAAPGGHPWYVYTPKDAIMSCLAPPLVGGATNLYAVSYGTSFSAPLAAGIAALIDSRYSGALNGGQLSSRLEQTSDDLGMPGVDLYYSHGRVNAYNAVTQK